MFTQNFMDLSKPVSIKLLAKQTYGVLFNTWNLLGNIKHVLNTYKETCKTVADFENMFWYPPNIAALTSLQFICIFIFNFKFSALFGINNLKTHTHKLYIRLQHKFGLLNDMPARNSRYKLVIIITWLNLNQKVYFMSPDLWFSRANEHRLAELHHLYGWQHVCERRGIAADWTDEGAE